MGAMSSKYNATPEIASRAYDADRDGFVIAGGGGMVVLEEYEHALARAYGVGSFLGMPSRVTYLIDRQGKVARVYPSVDPNRHAAEILRDLAQLPPS